MSTYSMMVGGAHPLAALWLNVLNVDALTVSRRRDMYIVNREGHQTIYLLARAQNPELEKHGSFLRKGQCLPTDTYWEYEFSIPEEFVNNIKAAGAVVTRLPFAEQFAETMRSLASSSEGGKAAMPSTKFTAEERAAAVAALTPVFEAVRVMDHVIK